jgi:hypothetical protein
MNGRRSKLVVSMLAIAILAVATAPLFAADHTHQMKGTIVSVDATAKTITFKDKDRSTPRPSSARRSTTSRR